MLEKMLGEIEFALVFEDRSRISLREGILKKFVVRRKTQKNSKAGMSLLFISVMSMGYVGTSGVPGLKGVRCIN